MYFQSFEQLIHMDGHGVYVWSCYGLFIAVIVWNLYSVARCRRLMLRQLYNHLRRWKKR